MIDTPKNFIAKTHQDLTRKLKPNERIYGRPDMKWGAWCSCGWEGKRGFVTKRQAVTFHFLHLNYVLTGEPNRPMTRSKERIARTRKPVR
ncbi:hypothetical protein PP304_gp034 [Gordonia phage Phendrix]|uniref:Uncharacterized protein n=1 Tax=Gordonia phage Phendrix TaxID=2593335 RepID=A0A514U0W7_9CAUD|nr:hypothetical protein PP304_gp034 [Gordonia phage Phendrix]QDK02582.1 hypothetical protein SEA_PHENDRIX_34 [Gordonia phage Phendrix]